MVYIEGRFIDAKETVNIDGSTPGRGGLPYETEGMLVVSLRGVNIGFWSRSWCSEQSANILCRLGLV